MMQLHQIRESGRQVVVTTVAMPRNTAGSLAALGMTA